MENENETTGEKLRRELFEREPLASANADISALELKPTAKPAETKPAEKREAVGDVLTAAGASPLANGKHETFCQIVTGWGGDGEPTFAYRAYMKAYPNTDERSAKANAARLAARPEVRARIDYLRLQLCNATLIDKAALRRDIFKKRTALIEWGITHKEKGGAAIALNALRDQEKAQGLDAPEVSRTVEEEATGEHSALDGIMEKLQRVVKTTVRE